MSNIPENQHKSIVAFTADLWDHVCPSIRIVEPIKAAGFNLIQGSYWENDQIKVNLKAIDQSDIVVIQRDFAARCDQYPEVISTARSNNIPVVYELDDLLVELPENHPDADYYRVVKPAILQSVIEADIVTTSTKDLQQYLIQFNPNTHVLPNYLIDRYWKFPEIPSNHSDQPITIGYMAGHGHLPDLEMILPVLDRLLIKYSDRIRLFFWGLRPSQNLLLRSNVEWTHPYLVSYEDFAQYFCSQRADIFIAPLKDNVFNRCKSALKYLEYSSLGVPGVFSRSPSNEEIITDGINGFLASTSDEWEDRLSLLIEDQKMRIEIGKAAQDTVKNHWCLSSHTDRWEQLFNNLSVRDKTQNKEDINLSVNQQIQNWYIELNKKYLADKATNPLNEKISTLSENIETLNHIIIEKEQENSRLRSTLAEKQISVDLLNSQLAGIRSGIGWRIFEKFNNIRLIIFPPGSYSDRLMRLLFTSLIVLRHEGIVAVAKKAWLMLTRKAVLTNRIQELPAVEIRIDFSVETGEKVLLPPISILIISGETDLEENEVLAWLKKQTYREVEVLNVDLEKQSLSRIYPEQKNTQANADGRWMDQVSGKYVCIASRDFVKQNETYLESNLFALETEELIFTINVHGKSTWIDEQIKAGALPGKNEIPASWIFLRKEYLSDDFTLDLPKLTNLMVNKVVGKILKHTVDSSEASQDFTFSSKVFNAELKLDNRRIVLAANSHKRPVPMVIHPLESVIPICTDHSDKPTALVVMPFLAVGGAERIAINMMRYLKEEIRFIVVTLDEHDPAIGNTVNNFRSITPYVYTSRDYLINHLNYSLFVYLIEKYSPTTIYVANGSPWIYDAISTLKASYPAIRFANQVYDHEAGWINRYDPVLVNSFMANIGENQKICDAFETHGVVPEHIYLIENGVDVLEYDPDLYPPKRIKEIKNNLGIPPNKRVITFMARLHPQKRPMDFVELARRCASDSSLQFLLIGDGPLQEIVDQEIHRIGLTNIIRIPFYKPSSDIFAVTDVYVLPSEYEGMPMVVLEAQSMGKPVVVTDVGNNREVIEITSGGVVVPRIGDPSGLRDGVYQMLKNPPEPGTLRKRIINNYNLEKMAREYKRALLGD